MSRDAAVLAYLDECDCRGCDPDRDRTTALRAVLTRPPLQEVGDNDQHAQGYNLALQIVRADIAHWLGVPVE